MEAKPILVETITPNNKSMFLHKNMEQVIGKRLLKRNQSENC